MSALRLDRAAGALWDAAGRRFDAAGRCWVQDDAASAGVAVAPLEAARWLQQDSGQPCRVPVGVIGAREASERDCRLAEDLGRALAELGVTVICGGKGGVMAAACRGVAARGGLSIGLLPDDHWSTANPFVGVPIATGIGEARNAVIARASLCLVAVGGGYGTLSEMAYGLKFGRPVFALGDAPQVAGARRLTDADQACQAVARILLAL